MRKIDIEKKIDKKDTYQEQSNPIGAGNFLFDIKWYDDCLFETDMNFLKIYS